LLKNLDTGRATETKPKYRFRGKNEAESCPTARSFAFTFRQIKVCHSRFYFHSCKSGKRTEFFTDGEASAIVKEYYHPTEKSGARAAA
jgi:hypothetical protein